MSPVETLVEISVPNMSVIFLKKGRVMGLGRKISKSKDFRSFDIFFFFEFYVFKSEEDIFAEIIRRKSVYFGGSFHENTYDFFYRIRSEKPFKLPKVLRGIIFDG